MSIGEIMHLESPVSGVDVFLEALRNAGMNDDNTKATADLKEIDEEAIDRVASGDLNCVATVSFICLTFMFL